MRAAILGSALVLMAVVLAAPRGAMTADPCANPTVPGLVGTNGNDVIRGTERGDIIYGHGGNDTICGLGGVDTLHGHQGNDTIYGGAGRDTLYGSYGDDDLYGQADNDTFFAGTNDDQEDDFCNGGQGTRDRNPEGDCDRSTSIERQ